MPEESGDSTDRDELFGELCVEQGYLTPGQLAEGREALKAAAGLGMEFSLSEVLVSKKLLTGDEREEVMRVLRVRTGEARIVGGYEVIAKIGEGGMGVVYKARSTSSGEHVALKVLPPSLARDGTLLKRFRREAELTRTLEHENIVRCVEFGFDRERKLHYCALELIEGEDLGKRIARTGELPLPEALGIARQIACAIEHASSHGLIHRDIKPQNIMLTPEGTAKLLDLGLARSVAGEDTRLTRTGTFAGSPHYAGPEQARGDREIDVRADIYSLGATLYHMVTGETPFPGATTAAVLAEVMKGRLAWPADLTPDVSEGACWLIARMTMRDPADRYQTPAELLRDLDLVIAGKELPAFELARGKTAITRPGARAGRGGVRRTGVHRAVSARAGAGRTTVIAAGLLGFAVVAVAAFLVFSGRPVKPPQTTETRQASARAPAGEADRERKLEDMFGFAKKYLDENPDQFERAVKYFERVRDEGRGTRFELMADSQMQEVRRRWKEAAKAAFEAAAKRAREVASAGEFDGAQALLDAIPGHLASLVEAETRDESARIAAAGRQKIARVIADAEEKLSSGDAGEARSSLAKLDGIRFGRGITDVRARVETLRARIDTLIDEAEKAGRAEAFARARDALAGLLAEFDDLVKRGRFAEARRRMESATADRSNAASSGQQEDSTDRASTAGTLRVAGRVAGELQKRGEAIVLAAEGLIGKTVTLKTAGGVRKGEVEKADEEGLTLAAKVIINREVRGVTRFTVGWAELSPEEEDRLAKGWNPTPPDGHVARAFVALGREDPDAAERALAAAGAHPLSELVRKKIDALKAGELEAAAKRAWEAITAAAEASGVAVAPASRGWTYKLIDAFETNYWKSTKANCRIALQLSSTVRKSGARSLRFYKDEKVIHNGRISRPVRLPPGAKGLRCWVMKEGKAPVLGVALSGGGAYFGFDSNALNAALAALPKGEWKQVEIHFDPAKMSSWPRGRMLDLSRIDQLIISVGDNATPHEFGRVIYLDHMELILEGPKALAAAGKGRLTPEAAKDLLARMAAFEKEYGATKFAASVAGALKALRERAERSAGRWIRIPPGKLRVEYHGGATSSVAGDTLAVRVQQGKGDHARIPILLAGTDFRLRLAYRGPLLEMFLRKGAGWRGSLNVVLTRDAIVVRTYPAEDDRKPDVLTSNRSKDVLSDDWHLVEATLKGSAFVLTVDGNAVSATQGLPVIGTGEAYILVWNTRGDTFRLRDVAFATDEGSPGTVTGLVTVRDKAGGWIEVKADDEKFARRYVPLEDAAGQFDRNMMNMIGKVFTPNRAQLAWKLQAGQRRVVGLQMQPLNEGDSGATVGTVTDAGKSWFELTPGDGRRDRYIPRWIGGMPADGGGLEKPILQAISKLAVGDRIRVDWVYDIRKRAVRLAKLP